MLVLTRKNGESQSLREYYDKSDLGGERFRPPGSRCPRRSVYRQEIYQAIREENLRAVGSRKIRSNFPSSPQNKPAIIPLGLI